MFTRLLCLLVWLGGILLSVASAASNVASPGTDPVPRPVWFEENSGQAPGDIAFIGRGFGVPLVVFKSGVLALAAESGPVRLEPERNSALASVHGEAPTGAVTRAYGPDGASVSRHYSSVRVSNLWPGADLFYRVANGRLELGLDLVAGQTAIMPSLRWRGAKVSLDRQGCVHVRARGLRLTLRAPSAFQPAATPENRAVNVRYQLGPAGRLQFRVQGADAALPLNIDPVFEFSTYIGGAQSDSIAAMALGPDGGIYLTGQSASTNLFGLDTGVRAGSGKVLVTRLAPGGVSVAYAALIGGSGSDQGTGIAVDSSGAAYVTGNSNSSNFPRTSGAFQSVAAQDWNAIALKLDASGALVYSTILGGSGPDWGSAIAVDNVGRAVVTGQTISTDFPVTAQAYQRLFAGAQDCFVTMLADDGKSLVFSTFLGGSDLDNCRAIALSPSGAITLAGSTRSSDFPVLGAFQTKNAGFLDGFVLQLNGTGSTLLSSSYLGGIGEDQLSSVALDSSGYVYVAGTTSTQANFPGAAAGVVTKNGGGRNGFACKITPSLVSLNWCSIVGGSGEDYANALALLPTGEVVVAGQTTSVNLPVVNALQSVFQGASDGWFAVLSSAGSQWETVSYTGGSAANTVNAVLAFQDRILLAGSTTALNLPVTTGAFQSTAGGGGDGFLQEVAIGSGIVLNGVYPASGYGFTHSLSLVVTDPSGGQSIQTVQVNVSNPYSISNACVVTFTVASKTLSLLSDAGSASVGTTTAGSNAILQNSQCSVAASTSSLSVSGNSVSLRLSLTYKSAFAALGAGAGKYVGVSIADNQGKTLSVPQAAVWFLSAQQPPAVVSLTPASGKGSSQTFVLTVSDQAGAGDLASVQLLVGSATALANGCAVTYIAKQNQFALSSDSGATYAGVLAPGQAVTVSNSQCTLSGAGSAVQLSGKSFVMTANLQFTPSFAVLGGSATKTVFALPLTVSSVGPMGGMTAVGTWTVPLPVPTIDAITPSSGTGAAQAFALSVSDPAGASDLATVQLLFGSTATPANACSVTYIAQQKLFALSNDAGTGYAGTLAAGQATTVSNSQCTLVGSGSSVNLSGKSLVMTASLQFTPVFAVLGGAAKKNSYALPLTASGSGPSGGLTAVGTWTIPLSAPGVDSITPSSGTGAAQAFALSVSDPAGASDLATVQLLFGSTATPANACSVTYIAQQKLFALSNDAGTGYAGTLAAGQATIVSNSQCTLVGSGSSVSLSGKSLVMTASLQFTPAFAVLGGAAKKNIYALPLTASGSGPSGGLTAVGTWTVPSPVPTIDAITPASGVGAAQSFALSVSDLAGASDLATIQLLFGTSAASSNACSVTYIAQQKLFALFNDAGTGYAGTLAAGQATTVSNSQCTLVGSGSSVTLSGKSLAMTASLQFAPAFAILGGGAKKTIYALPLTASGAGPSGGMTAVGTWTVLLPVPTVDAITPVSGVGAAQSFALSVSDPAGASDLATVQLLFGSSASASNACSVNYLSQQKLFALSNDAGTGYAGTLAPGQATTVSNSQCTLVGSGSSVNLSGTVLTMVVSLQFSPSFGILGSGATKNIYVKPVTAAGQGPVVGYVQTGTWTIPQTAATGPLVLVSLTPLSGQGMSQAFTLIVSDIAGASDLATVHLVVSGPANYGNACWMTYSAQTHMIGLVNDAAAAYVGYVAPGQATSYSNSQCTLSGSGTSVQLAGNLLTLKVNLQFSSSFSKIGNGATKTVYAYPITTTGKAPPAIVPMGTWTIGQSVSSPPAAVSITPSSGQGLSQAFTLTVSDPLGASDLATVQLLFGTSTNTSGACMVTYDPQQGKLGLTNDAGTGYSGYVTPGQPVTASNSQCTLSGSGSSIQTSGNSLTMTANLQFTSAFAGSGGSAVKTMYALPVSITNQAPPGGFATLGTWTIPQTGTPAPPSVGSLTPSSGQGGSQSFALTVSDPAGASDLASVQLHFGSSTGLASACSVTYSAQQNSFSLINDGGTASAGTVAPGQATLVSNSQCSLRGTGSSVAASGTTLTLTVNLQFSTAFAGLGSATKNVYANALNAAGQGPAGGFVTVGTWTVPQGASGPPAVVSLSPSTGQGASASFVLAVTAPGGGSTLSTVQLVIGSSSALASACSVTYIAQQNAFGLTNDAGTGYGAYVSPAQATTVSNSQCTLSGTGSSVQITGNTLTMTLNMQFSPAFAGAGNGPVKNVYAKPVDAAGQAPAAGLTLMGTWTIPQPVVGGPPTPVSLTPASGRGAAQAFVLVISDSAGAADLSAVHFVVSGPAVLTGACWITYFPANNSFGLVTDSAAAYAGYVTPGQGKNVSNSQCTLSGVGTTIQSSGNLLTMTMNLTFSQSFSKLGSGATKTVYALPVNLAGKAPPSLVTMGTWTLP